MRMSKKEANNRIYNRKLRNYEDRLVNIIKNMGQVKGQNKKLSKIIAYLLIHKENGLSQEDLRKLTGFSLGTISNNLNTMATMGYVKKELYKGKYLYSFGDMSALGSKTSVLKADIYQKAEEFFKDIKTQLDDQNNKNKAGSKLLSERIDDMMNFIKLGQKIVEEISKPEFFAKILQKK